MRTTLKNIIIIALVIAVCTASCDDKKVDTSDQKAAFTRMIEMKTRMNALNAGAGQMTGFMSVIGNSQYKSGDLSIGGVGIDSTYRDSAYVDTTFYWEYITCAKVTETDNGDGTFTTVYDYGEGCEEYGSIMRGKITYIWSNTGNDYYSKVIYDNYYGWGVEINGYSEYTFTSDGNSWFGEEICDGTTDSTVVVSPVFNWSGTSSGKDDITYIYDSGESYYYSSEYSNKWDSVSFTVLTGDYMYVSESEDYEYHYFVSEPVVTDYTCWDSWIPVSGIETVTYKDKEQVYNYMIDYGTGTCDNLATVTENGKTTVIDFSEWFYKIYDDSVSSGSSLPGSGKKGKK